MKKEAILHMPLSEYAYATGQHSLVIRLRVAKSDMKECVLFYGDRTDPNKQIRVKPIFMERLAQDDLFDYYVCNVKDHYTRVCYYFSLTDRTGSLCFYDERGLHEEVTENRTEFFQFPYIRREDRIQIPEWAKHIVMYHIFPDSFATGKRELIENKKEVSFVQRDEAGEKKVSSAAHLGGTLRGIRENIPYLSELGVNCIYLNPIFTANSYHKYDTIDYFSVDPCFGTMDDLKEMVEACHEAKIRVLLDGVFNHCGPDFFAFRDVMERGSQSPYYDWFYHMPEPVCFADPPNYEAFAYVKEMPKLNTGNPQVEEYFANVGVYWIEKAGIDGWRLDVANEVNHDFWRRFRKVVKAAKPDAFLIGEIWEDAGIWLAGDQFDSTMNYRFSNLCKDFFATNRITVSEFDAQIQKMILRYPENVSLAQMNFLDSHDVPRFLSYCSCKEQMELAFFYLAMGYGVPSFFYGDEMYIEGTEEPEYRQGMKWKEQNGCGDKIRAWIAFRKMHRCIRDGQYLTVDCENADGFYAFARKNEEECILILINNSEKVYTVSDEKWNRFEEKLGGSIVYKKDELAPYAGETYRVK